jgi:uracil-DNA glycosylase
MKPTERIHNSWDPIKPYLNTEELVYLRGTVLPSIIYYPKREDIFRVFSLPVNKVNVVILGQDPYHGPNQATGLSFSIHQSMPTPPSLKIIQQEIEKSSIKQKWGTNPLFMGGEWKTLNHWEEQGVLLLNTALTVESGKPGSHLKYWENFIKRVINYISSKNPCVWLLWGKKAQSFIPYINKPFIVDKYTDETIDNIPLYYDKNYVIRASHPASEVYRNNAGFIGCNHFKYSNTILEKTKKLYINW